MKRVLVALALTVAVTACGGNASTAPSSVATTAPPVYPNLVAAWSGTATIGAVTMGTALSNICQTTWIVSNQTAGSFSGTFQLSGGTTVACGQSSNISGSVTTAGAVTIQFTSNPPPSGCVLLGGTDLTGVVTGSAMTLQQTIHLTCSGSSVDQTVTLALTRR